MKGGWRMEVKVAILNDNMAGPPAFKAEHGLSVLVEVEGLSFLWDCGATDITVRNARAMGINLGTIEGIGLSHGHYDHCGGLMAVLEASGPKKVFMHPEAFTPKYAIFGEIQRFIGIQYSKVAIEGASLGVELSKEAIEVMPGVKLTGEVPRVTEFEGLEPNLYCLMDGNMVPDPFLDDQALVVDTPEGAVVLTGCAHSGVVNILKHVLESHERIRAVVGGTHLGLGDVKRLQPTIEFLDEVAPEKMIFTHCTGPKAAALMMERFKERFVPSQTGLQLSV
jgi:7,8-dihydropterin-6-yl-methyl-4-(beta-D-ribofuranosyl)aminobenzene 5'-phosphate synthase